MAAPSHVSLGVTAHNATTPKTVNAGTRAIGDLIVVLIQQVSSGTNTYSVSDTQGNTYTKRAEQIGASSRYVAIYSAVVTTAGATTVSVAATGGINYAFTACWATPDTGATIEFDVASSFADAANATSHPMAAVGEIDTAAEVLIYAVAANDGSMTVTDPTNYTRQTDVIATRGMSWRRASAGALTDERPAYGTSGGVVNIGAVASFKTVAGGGGGSSIPVFMNHYRNQGIA